MEILYSDKQIVVCIKPVGLDAEAGMSEALSKQLGGKIFPVHRLDLNVGGVMVYARTKQAAAALSRAIQDGKMVKEYVAMVHGIPEPSRVLEDLLWKDSKRNKVFIAKTERAGVKKASLEYIRLTDTAPSLLRIRLHTGRSHQIRVQFASRGFPLVGDHKYGARDDVPCPMLYSCCLSFPFGKKDYRFEHFPEWYSL